MYYVTSKNMHSSTILSNIHNDIIKKLDIKSKIAQEKKEVPILQDFLVALKRQQLQSTSIGNIDNLNKLNAYAEQKIVQDIFNSLITMGEKNYSLMQSGGTIFEVAFSALQACAAKYLATERNIDLSKYLTNTNIDLGKIDLFNPASYQTGTKQVGFGELERNILNLSQNLTKDIMKTFLLGEQGSETLSHNKKQSQIIYSKVSQKVDNQGLINADIIYELNNKAEKALSILISRNFSLKNYRRTQGQVGIGATVPYRSISSVLQGYLGLSKAESDKIFFQSITALKNKTNSAPAVNTHFNHLQSIYEFTGLGQKIFINGEAIDTNSVDYLIINDPTSINIEVVGVYSILQSKLEEENNRVFNRERTYSRNFIDTSESAIYWS